MLQACRSRVPPRRARIPSLSTANTPAFLHSATSSLMGLDIPLPVSTWVMKTALNLSSPQLPSEVVRIGVGVPTGIGA